MVAGNSSDSLPPGFMEKIKVSNGRKVKIYIESSTGNKFYSRLAVARYFENGDLTKQSRHDTSLQSKSSTEAAYIPGEDLEIEKSFTTVAPERTSSGGLPPSEAVCNPGKKLDGKKSFTVVTTENTSVDGLPPGWVKEIKIRESGNKIRKDLYYIDPVSGYIFFSKKDVFRYLETNDIGSCSSKPKKKEFDDSLLNKNDINPDRVGEPILNHAASPQCLSVSHDSFPKKLRKNKRSLVGVAAESASAVESPASWIKETETTKSGNKIRKVEPDDGTLVKPDMPTERISMTDEDCAPEKKKAKHSFSAVTIETTSADGLPPGWIKEIRTSKSGNKIRKDPYYIDPVSGYMFYSKKDVMRFLETKNISSCAITPKRRKLDDQKLIENRTTLDNAAENFSKPKAHLEHEPIPDKTCIPETKGGSKESFTTVATDSTSVEGLPPGWTKEIQTRQSGNRMRKHPYFVDPCSGYMFHSKKDVMRYLETNDINSCAITPRRRELDGLKVDNVEESFSKSGISVPCQSTVNGVSGTETKKKSHHSSTTVCTMRSSILSQDLSKPLIDAQLSTEISSADGLPPGWIKEIIASKSGNKVRKDPYYIDPVSGYVFRSKKDVFRFLETKDIGSCAITPKKRDANDLKSIDNKTPPPSGIDRKLSVHEALETDSKLIFGESNGAGGYGSGAIKLAASKAKISKFAFAGVAVQDKKSSKNSDKHPEDTFSNISSADTFSSQPVLAMKIGSEQTNACPEQGARAMAEVLAICSVINESFTEEKLPEIGKEKRTDGTELRREKTKKLPESGKEKQTDGTELRHEKTKKLPESGKEKQTHGTKLRHKKGKKLRESGKEKQTDGTELRHEKGKKVPENGKEKRSDGTELRHEKGKKLPEIRIEKQTGGTRLTPRKSKKIRDLNLPLRASKRLSRSDPDMIPNVDLNERALRATAKTLPAPSIPLPYDVDQEKDVANRALMGEETYQEEEPSNQDEKLSDDNPMTPEKAPLNNAEKPLVEDRAISEEEPSTRIEQLSPKDISEKCPSSNFENPRAEEEDISEKEPLNEVERTHSEHKAFSTEQTEDKAIEEQLIGDTISQNSQPIYAWTDPCLEFAFKTLTGEIPIDNALSFPTISYNQEVGGSETSELEASTMFDSDIPPGFESVKQKMMVQNLAANQPFSSPRESTIFHIDEIPPGFESVARTKTAQFFPANPSFSSPEVSTGQRFPFKSS